MWRIATDVWYRLVPDCSDADLPEKFHGPGLSGKTAVRRQSNLGLAIAKFILVSHWLQHLISDLAYSLTYRSVLLHTPGPFPSETTFPTIDRIINKGNDSSIL